jgi:hypothetical protein
MKKIDKNSIEKSLKYIVFYIEDKVMRERIIENEKEAYEFVSAKNGSIAPIYI